MLSPPTAFASPAFERAPFGAPLRREAYGVVPLEAVRLGVPTLVPIKDPGDATVAHVEGYGARTDSASPWVAQPSRAERTRMFRWDYEAESLRALQRRDLHFCAVLVPFQPPVEAPSEPGGSI